MLSIQYVRDGVCEKGSESGTIAYVTEEATEREIERVARVRSTCRVAFRRLNEGTWIDCIMYHAL